MEYEKMKKSMLKFLYISVIVLAVFILVKYGLGLFAPFLLAFIIAYLLKTPAKFIAHKTKIPYKPVALLLVALFYSTIGVLVVVLIVKLIASSANLIADLPSIYTRQIEPYLRSFFADIEQAIYRMDPALTEAMSNIFTQLVQSLRELITNLSLKVVGSISSYASSLPGLLIKLLLMIISTFFIAADYDILTGFVLRQCPDKWKALIFRIKEYVIGTLFVCIRSYMLIMCITFVELALGLSLIGVPNSILIAFSVSIFDILPVLGTGGIMIPWTIITALQGNYPLALGLLIIYLIITVVRNIIEPKIVGSQIGLHPVVTLISIFVGAQLFGIIGLFGLPIILSLLRHLNDTGTIKLFK